MRPGDGVERRGLAAAIGAEQRHHAAFGHFQRNVGDADQVAVANFQMLDLEQRRGHVRGPAHQFDRRMAGGGLGGALAEIGLDHGRIAGDLARAAARDLAALVKHHHARRQRHDDFHDVLDDHQRDAGTMDVAHQIDRELHLALGEARHRFIEQQHLGFGRERTRDLEPLAAGRSERARRRIRQPAHADALQHGARFGFGFGAMRGAQKRADHHVLQHRHALEGLRHLEGAGEAELRARLRRHAR